MGDRPKVGEGARDLTRPFGGDSFDDRLAVSADALALIEAICPDPEARNVPDALDRLRTIRTAIGLQLTTSGYMQRPDRPPPTWRPNDGSDRHVQDEAGWDWRKDRTGAAVAQSVLRLNWAADYSDPRAPDQMAVVLRIDVLRLLSLAQRLHAARQLAEGDAAGVAADALALLKRWAQERGAKTRGARQQLDDLTDRFLRDVSDQPKGGGQ